MVQKLAILVCFGIYLVYQTTPLDRLAEKRRGDVGCGLRSRCLGFVLEGK